MKLNQSFLYGMGSGLILASILFGASELLQTDKPSQAMQPEQTAGTSLAQQQQPSGGTTAAQQQQPAAADNGQPAASTQTAQGQPSGQSANSGKVKLDISEGMNARQIADLLVQKGIISDADSFLSAAGNRVNSIRTGTYELPLKADHQQVLAVITKG